MKKKLSAGNKGRDQGDKKLARSSGGDQKQSRPDLLGEVLAGAPSFSYGIIIGAVVDCLAGGEHIGADGVRKALAKISAQIREGNVDHLEELLLLQAELLNHVFVKNIALIGGAKELSGIRVFAEVALKSQNQSRRTILALAELKNPKRATFIKNSAVNQQVNMGEMPSIHGKEPQILEKNLTDEIIENLNNVERMDAREKAKTK